MLQDLKQSLRALRRAPRFTLAAIATLALALGLNCSVFAVLDALVLRPLALADPERTLQLSLVTRNGQSTGLSFPAFRQLSAETAATTRMTAWSGGVVLTVEADQRITRGFTWCVTGNMFREFGVTAALGRLLEPSDVVLDPFTPTPVAVLGYDFWHRHFAGDAGVVGKTIRVEGVPFTIVGVAPQGFRGLSRTLEPDVTVPLTAHALLFPGVDYAARGNVLWVRPLTRPADGISTAQTAVRLAAAMPSILADTVPPEYAGARRDNFLSLKLRVEDVVLPSDQFVRNQYARPLSLVLGISAAVLLIASVNLASLVIARTTNRQREWATRMALGAGSWRALRLVFCEALLLAGGGALGGIAIALMLGGVIARAIVGQASVPMSLDIRVDTRLVMFAATLALLALALFAAIPMWLLQRSRTALRLTDGLTSTASPAVIRAIAVIQIALAVLLLTHVGLLARSFLHLRGQLTGIATDAITVAFLEPRPGADPTISESYLTTLVEGVATDAGAPAVVTRFVPAAGAVPMESVASIAPGEPSEVQAIVNDITPGFFQTLTTSMYAGRDFTWRDGAGQPAVAIISRSLSRRLFGRDNSLGEQLRIGAPPRLRSVEVVGISADVSFDVKSSTDAVVYLPLLQRPQTEIAGGLTLLIGAAHADAHRAVESAGRHYVSSSRRLQDLTGAALAEQRVTAVVAEWFGVIAVMFVGVGTYGLASYTTACRRREYGVRMALGAEPSQISRGILWSSVTMGAQGVGLGVLIALASAPLLRAVVFGVGVYDGISVACAGLVVLTVVVLASWSPARYASRLDLSQILRPE